MNSELVSKSLTIHSSKHKDKSLEELLFDLKENQQNVTITEGNENYGKPLKQLQDQLRAFPRYWKLQEMFYEKVNETFKDEDLNDLRAIMSIKVRIDTFSLLLNPLRTVFDENLYTRKRYV